MVSRVFSQNYVELFMYMDNSSEMDCSIFLSNDNSYCIQLSFVYDDIVEVKTLSCGTFDRKGKDVILSDAFHGYETVFHEYDSCLVAQKSLPILSGKVFHRCSYWVNPYIDTANVSYEAIQREREAYDNAHKQLYKLKTGKYASSDGYDLVLQKSKTYNLKCKGHCLSSGTWKRENNNLILYDSSLGFPIHLFIGESQLIGKILPSDAHNLHPFKWIGSENTSVTKKRGFGCSRKH